jgi:hypothetical protein
MGEVEIAANSSIPANIRYVFPLNNFSNFLIFNQLLNKRGN